MRLGLVCVTMALGGAPAGCGGCDDGGGTPFEFADAGFWPDSADDGVPTVALTVTLAPAVAGATVTATVTPETDGEVVLVHAATVPGEPHTWRVSPERRYRLDVSAPGHQSITHSVSAGDGGTAIDLGTLVLTQGIRLGGAQYVVTGPDLDHYEVPQAVDPATGTLIVGTSDAWLRIRDPGSGALEITELEDLPTAGSDPRFSPDGTALFLSTDDEGLVAYDTTTWTRYAGDVGAVDASRLVFAGDGTKIAAGGVVFSWADQTLTTLLEAGDQYDTLSGNGRYLGFYDGANDVMYDTTDGTLYLQQAAEGSLRLSNDGAHIIHARSGTAFCPEIYDHLRRLGCTVAVDYQVVASNVRLFAVSPTVPAAIEILNYSVGFQTTIVRTSLEYPFPATAVATPSMSNLFTRAAAVGNLVVVQDDVIEKDPDTGAVSAHEPAAHAIDISTGVVGAEIPGQFTLHPRSDGSIALLEVFCDDGVDTCTCPLEWPDSGDCARRLVIIAPDATVAETIMLTEDIPFGPDRSQALTLDSWGHYFPGAALEQEAWIVATPATGTRRTIAHTTGLGIYPEEWFGPVTGDASPRILDAPCLVYARDEQTLPPSWFSTRGVYCVR